MCMCTHIYTIFPFGATYMCVDLELTTSVWTTYQWFAPKENWLSHLQQLLITLSSSNAGWAFILNISPTMLACHLCVLVWATIFLKIHEYNSPVQVQENYPTAFSQVFLNLKSPHPALSWCSLALGCKDYVIDFQFIVRHSKVTFSTFWPVVNSL